ncbi:MAG: hypothetical protein ACREQX_00830, partial [Candidatus Binataceae bacterium]
TRLLAPPVAPLVRHALALRGRLRMTDKETPLVHKLGQFKNSHALERSEESWIILILRAFYRDSSLPETQAYTS